MVTSVAISTDSNYMAVGTRSGSYNEKSTVILFGRSNSTPIWEYNTDQMIISLDISGDGENIVASTFNKIYLFSKNNSTPTWIYRKDQDTNQPVIISDDGNYIFAAIGNKVTLFEKSKPFPIRNYTLNDDVSLFDISINGSYITMASKSKIYLFGNNNSIPIWISDYLDYMITAIAISDDANFICAIGDACPKIWAGKIILLDKSNTLQWNYTLNGRVRSPSIAISSDGNSIVAGEGGTVYIFNNSNSLPIGIYKLKNTYSTFVDISKRGDHIVAVIDHNIIYFFKKSSSFPIWVYRTNSAVESIEINTNGNYIFAGTQDGTCILFDTNNLIFVEDFNTQKFFSIRGFIISSLIFGILISIYYFNKFVISKSEKVKILNERIRNYFYFHSTGLIKIGKVLISTSASGYMINIFGIFVFISIIGIWVYFFIVGPITFITGLCAWIIGRTYEKRRIEDLIKEDKAKVLELKEIIYNFLKVNQGKAFTIDAIISRIAKEFNISVEKPLMKEFLMSLTNENKIKLDKKENNIYFFY